MNCDHCGSEVPTQQPACLRCGTPVPGSLLASDLAAEDATLMMRPDDGDDDATLFDTGPSSPADTAEGDATLLAGSLDDDATLFDAGPISPADTAEDDATLLAGAIPESGTEDETRLGSAEDQETALSGSGSSGSGASSASASEKTGPLDVGQPFGTRYQILKVLGVGGMGAVYQAWDQELGVAVALKVIRTEVTDPKMAEEMSARFKRELLLAREVTHKNVVRIHDLGDIDGMKYFTMSFVKGEDLSSLLEREGNLSVERALEVFRQVVDGLIAAHDKGIVHRDLKPANIMIDGEGNALLMDFGIARSSGPAAEPAGGVADVDMDQLEAQEINLGQTMAGAIVGTLEYMAPEQFRGQVADQRADVYALGLILYDLLLGRRRVKTAKSAIAEVKGRLREPPPPPNQVDESIPEALASVVARCLDPDPDQRFATTTELMEALDELDEHGQPLPRFTRKTLLLGALAALAVVGALAATFFFARGTGLVEEPPPMSVLVADFENQTGEEVFADTLEQAVAIGLEGASFVNTFPRGRARSRAEEIRPGSESLDAELSQLVAQSEGVDVVIGGSIAPRGNGYELAIEATDAVTGEVLGEQKSRADNQDEVLPAIGELVVRLRRRLGDTVPDAVAAAEEETFTAGSLEAAQNYARAQDLMASGAWRESVPLYEKAVELDPEFGRAYAGLGAVYFNLGEAQEAEGYYQQALAQITRMTERERYRTRAGYYLRVGNWDQAVEELQSLVDNYPADEAGLSNLALANFFARNFDQALERGRQAVETYPNNVLSRANLALYAMYAGDFETAEEEAVQVITDNPAYETAYVALAMAEIDGGDLGAASEWYRQLRTVSTRGASIANLGEADLALFRGDLAAAADLLEGGVVADTASDQTSMAQFKRVALAATRQELGDAVDLEELEQWAGEVPSARVRFEAALVLAAAGEGERARELGEEIAASGSNDAMAMKHLIDGEVALRDDSALAAIQSFQEARRLADSWLARYGLGRAHLVRGSFAEAHSELDRCYTRRGEATAIFFDDLPSYHYLPPLLYYLGRALEGLGSEGATDEYRGFLAIRGGAEEDPLVIDARARIQALNAQ